MADTTDTLSEAEFLKQQMEEEERLAAFRTVPQGKIYMGPKISEEQFSRLPQGARIMPPAPPAGSAPSMLQQLQAADRPGSRTIAVNPFTPSYTAVDPVAQRFAANEGIRRAVESGMQPAQAIAMYGGGLFAPSQGARPMSEYQQAQVKKWNTPATLTPMQSAMIDRWRRQEAADAAKVATETITETIPAQKEVPEILAEKRTLLGIDRLRKDQPYVPGIPGRGEQKITRKVPVGQSIAAPVTGANQRGIPIKDIKGKTWLYLGTNPNPKTDTNPDNWVEQ